MPRKTSAIRPKTERVQDDRVLKFKEQARSRARHADRRSATRERDAQSRV